MTRVLTNPRQYNYACTSNCNQSLIAFTMVIEYNYSMKNGTSFYSMYFYEIAATTSGNYCIAFNLTFSFKSIPNDNNSPHT